MTDDVKTEEEPSIEEILDSIRQIIADDDEDGGEGEGKEGDSVADGNAEDETPDEPLDQSAIDDMDFNAPEVDEPEPNEDSAEPLNQSAIDDIDFDTPTPEPEPEEEVIELTDRVENEDVDLVDVEQEDEPTPEPEITTEPEPEPDPEPKSEPEIVSNNDALLTKNAENAAFDAISELARKTAIEHNGITLEEIVRSEIKPMLSIWLDKNLPVIIERLVREELERVSKRVLED